MNFPSCVRKLIKQYSSMRCFSTNKLNCQSRYLIKRIFYPQCSPILWLSFFHIFSLFFLFTPDPSTNSFSYVLPTICPPLNPSLLAMKPPFKKSNRRVLFRKSFEKCQYKLLPVSLAFWTVPGTLSVVPYVNHRFKYWTGDSCSVSRTEIQSKQWRSKWAFWTRGSACWATTMECLGFY